MKGSESLCWLVTALWLNAQTPNTRCHGAAVFCPGLAHGPLPFAILPRNNSTSLALSSGRESKSGLSSDVLCPIERKHSFLSAFFVCF